MKRFTYAWTLSMSAFFLVLLPGCGSMSVPMSDSEVNSALFDGKPEVFKERTATLKARNQVAVANGKRLTLAEVFQTLDIDPKTKNFEIVDRNSARVYVYGNTNLSSMVDAEKMRGVMDRTVVHRLKFMSRKTGATLKAPIHVRYHETGYDINLILVFEDNELQSAWEEGFDGINTSRSEILINPFKYLGGRR